MPDTVSPETKPAPGSLNTPVDKAATPEQVPETLPVVPPIKPPIIVEPPAADVTPPVAPAIAGVPVADNLLKTFVNPAYIPLNEKFASFSKLFSDE